MQQEGILKERIFRLKFEEGERIFRHKTWRKKATMCCGNNRIKAWRKKREVSRKQETMCSNSDVPWGVLHGDVLIEIAKT